MNYAGFLIRRERLKRDWSQEGLCMGVCTVSYLSKIEQGKAEPSPEITGLLFKRMGLSWNDGKELCDLVESAYEAIMAGDYELYGKILASENWPLLDMSPCAPDKMLMDCFANNTEPDIDDELEICLTQRQLALLRILQGREDEAVKLFPCAMTCFQSGVNKYSRGHTSQAIELFGIAYDMAAREGYVRIMLNSRAFMGNCYSDKHDIPSMEAHYKVALRLAEALRDENILTTIPYNIAATKIELGDYAAALEYFENRKDHNTMSLHKLAICYEKTGQREKALDAIDRALSMNSDNEFDQLTNDICALVKMRLTDREYLKSDSYEKLLFSVFNQCRSQLAMGYAIFHLPWVLEWYEARRQYKQAYALLRDFPEAPLKTGV